jgi:hypothetical protein
MPRCRAGVRKYVRQELEPSLYKRPVSMPQFNFAEDNTQPLPMERQPNEAFGDWKRRLAPLFQMLGAVNPNGGNLNDSLQASLTESWAERKLRRAREKAGLPLVITDKRRKVTPERVERVRKAWAAKQGLTLEEMDERRRKRKRQYCRNWNAKQKRKTP